MTWDAFEAAEAHYTRLLEELDQQREKWGDNERIKHERDIVERARAAEKLEAARA